ncbi:LssY C-terminal domain-containing protein [Candidatus Burkholderia verschuerenii]|uniref:LssY C-terminal domain-containing protein n=1 Tax=Candidatus Burkholderia verschuerenii TaxID=242163 RepID=UPI000AE95BE4|nr:LssY C-terminal domain-containing protein [Candidatus Burkholderia verschuerenii]
MLTGVIVATATSAIVTAVALAGLYFGRFTISDALGSAALAAIWVFLIALTAVWRHPVKPRRRPLMPVAVLAVIAASVALQLTDDSEAHSAPMPTVVITPIQWTDTVWRTFSCYRSSMEGDRREPITVQWAATPGQIRAQLAGRGWAEVNGVSMKSTLSVVSPNAPAVALPVLPRLNNGEPSTLVFTRSHLNTQERDVLRFWPTHYAVRERQNTEPCRSGSVRSCTSESGGRRGRSTCCGRTAASIRWRGSAATIRRGAASKLLAVRDVAAFR